MATNADEATALIRELILLTVEAMKRRESQSRWKAVERKAAQVFKAATGEKPTPEQIKRMTKW